MLRVINILIGISLLAASQVGLDGQTTVTLAGTGSAGFSGDGGPGVQAQINNPYGLVIGPDGALYFCEIGNHRVRRLDLKTGIISTVAGSGQKGYAGDGGPALAASMNEPYEVRFDRDGNMYFCEMQNHVVRRVDARTHVISTVAGTGVAGFAGDGGPASKAQLRQPHSIAFDPQGRLLICDIGNLRIRRVDLKTGVIDTWAGTGEKKPTPDGAPISGTPLNGPRAITADPQGNLYLVLREGNQVFRMDPRADRIYHLAGTGETGYTGDGGPAKSAKLSGPKGIAWAPDGSLYLADTESHTIRRIDLKSGIINTVVGTGQRGNGPDGAARQCHLSRPHGIFVSEQGKVFIADSESHRVRTLEAGGIVAKLRAEAAAHSEVAPVFDMFTVAIGPRLTASPGQKRAAEYARGRLAAYGLENARLEPWHFGRGWTLEKLTVEMIEPRYMPLIAYADAWSPSTKGEIVGTPILMAGKPPEQLKGAIVMSAPIMTTFVRNDRPQPSDPGYVPNSAAYATSVGQPANRAGRGGTANLLRDSGAAVVLKPSRGEHGTVFVSGRDNGDNAAPSVTLAAEHYNMIAMMLQQNIPVRLRVSVQSKFYDSDGGNAYNVLAELPGSDPALRDEVVMIGGHLDSWHTGVGATDNADGATTVMEAMRLLKAIDARPRRTIRVALWSGEEQGLLGSKAWVAAHAGQEKIDAYFNIDNGTGPIYGWYLQNHEAVRPLFDQWLEPLKDLGARRNIIEPIGSTDHMSFLDAGVPGFNPIQDYTNYDVRTHHTNMDTVDRLDVNDIRQAAVVMAWFAYNTAMADEKLPRPPAK